MSVIIHEAGREDRTLLELIKSQGPCYPSNKVSVYLGNLTKHNLLRWVDFHVLESRPVSIELILEDSRRLWLDIMRYKLLC